MEQVGVKAKAAAQTLVSADGDRKNSALLAAAVSLRSRRAEIIASNNIDIEIYEYDANAGDDLFNLFHQKVWRFSIDDYKENLKINRIAAENQKKAIDEKSVRSMLGIQDLPQVGLKTIESIHHFIRNKKDIMIQSQLDIF